MRDSKLYLQDIKDPLKASKNTSHKINLNATLFKTEKGAEMNRVKSWALGVVLSTGILLAAAGTVMAQDPLEVGPDVYKLKFENERVRVMEVTFAPGASIAMHSHPDHFAYVITGGKLILSYPDGTSKEAQANPGDVLWMGAESHAAQNPGATELKLLVVELKAKSE